MTRLDPWRRELGKPFESLEREQYAQARAKGGTIKAAAAAAGVNQQTGTAYERHDAMRARIRELRQGAETFVSVSKAWVLEQLKINAEAAREENAYKASNEALGMIFKILSEDRDVGQQMARTLSPSVSGRELQKRLRESFREPPKLEADVREPEPATLDIVPEEDDDEEAAE